MSGDGFSRRYAVVTETRRRWSETEKEVIVAEAARPDANISAVARRHGIKPSLLFRWRRMARSAPAPTPEAAFIPVTLAPQPARAEPPPSEAVRSAGNALPPRSSEAIQHHADNRIEIQLGNGRLVRVGAGATMSQSVFHATLIQAAPSPCASIVSFRLKAA
jgi:transposase